MPGFSNGTEVFAAAMYPSTIYGIDPNMTWSEGSWQAQKNVTNKIANGITKR
jgi:hypothetical protein